MRERERERERERIYSAEMSMSKLSVLSPRENPEGSDLHWDSLSEKGAFWAPLFVLCLY